MEGNISEYELKRYRGLDQALLNALEKNTLGKLVLKYFNNKSSVLEITCGYGRMTEVLLRKKFKVTSSDVLLDMTRRCKERFGSRVGTVCADALRLPFRDEAFNYIVCLRLIQHGFKEKKLEKLLNEFYRVGKEMVIVSYYENNPFHATWRKLRGFKSNILMLSRKEFLGCTRSAGFKISKVYAPLRFFHAQRFVVLKKN